MDVALGLLAFWPALALGSFVNVVAARVPLRRSVVRPRSACMSCGSELAWYDNVPVLSYFLLRGRCRSCGTAISLLYPAVELATAGLVAACFVVFGLSGKAVLAAFFCAVLVALLLGAMLGRLVGVGLMLGMFAALVPSVVLFARHGAAARKMGIPFAPFLAFGAVVALFVGKPLLDAYFSTF